MPKDSIKAKMIQFQLEKGLGINRSHYMFYDNQFQNIQDFKTVISRLADFFGVNKTNVIYRLEGLGLIKRGNEVLTVGQIISRI